jgi:hypothetical protein
MFKKIVFPIVVTLSFMLTAFGLTGCTCSVFSQDTWSGGGNCAKQQAAERAVGEEKSQRELPALKRRADSGDVKAQVAMGEFHIFEHHPNSDRATGLAYYDKAGRQGDLQAQRILLTESHNDCRAKARKLGRKELDGPQYARIAWLNGLLWKLWLQKPACAPRHQTLAAVFRLRWGSLLKMLEEATMPTFGTWWRSRTA